MKASQVTVNNVYCCVYTVPSGCYGVPDEETTNEEAQSDDSSVSTVPWFCDACKAGVNDPV